MRRMVLLLVGALLALLPSAALAQPYPNVANLEPYSEATNFMSRAGYLRWLVFQQTGRWISHAEAEQIVRQQIGR